MRLNHRGKSISLLFLLVPLLFLVNSAQANEGKKTQILNKEICKSLHGNWTPGTINQCMVIVPTSNKINFSINSGDIIEFGGNFTNFGSITNYGTLITTATVFTNSGQILNYGKIVNQFINPGNVTIINKGKIVNFGTFENPGSGNASGVIINLGNFANNGYLTSNGIITNYRNMINSGIISNNGTITNICVYIWSGNNPVGGGTFSAPIC